AYSDGLVVKFNADMGIEWAQNFGGTGTDVLFDVDVLENGTIVAAGASIRTATSSRWATFRSEGAFIPPRSSSLTA
ncbi:MAG: hypothetical protein UH229_00870, partial [Lachnospiraceae bacterium]|nr:hypothetical protein [Lachnospiraceae bacterium]